jgi:hypothetical protein
MTTNCIFNATVEQLIQLKDMRYKEIESKYFELLSCERELKSTENTLYLETNFKELGLTNEKMRNAFVADNTNELKFKLDIAKYELKQQEHDLIILNDLIQLRLQEVKKE